MHLTVPILTVFVFQSVGVDSSAHVGLAGAVFSRTIETIY
jgi:hypothetical protein